MGLKVKQGKSKYLRFRIVRRTFAQNRSVYFNVEI